MKLILVVVALSTCSIAKQLPSTGTFELLILHNNDMHAKFEQTSQRSGVCTTEDREAGKCYGGFARVAYVVKEARKAARTGEGPPVLYLNAGDTYTGSSWFKMYKWKIAADFINAIQPDAVSLGNHEFDNRVSGLTPFIKNLTCPVLAANLNLTKVPELQEETNLLKSVVFDINGTKIGVIGYLLPNTKILARPNNVEYIEETSAIKDEAVKLKIYGVNILIALGHSGFEKDKEIAREIEDLDLVIGGHTNTFLWNGTTPDIENCTETYPFFVEQKSGRRVPVVQAYAYTKYLGRLHLVFDASGELIRSDGNPILLDKTVPQCPEVLEIVNRYKGKVEAITEEVVGNTLVILDGDCRLKECNMGNLITDAKIKKYASQYVGKGWTDAPIAVIQGGGIRATIAHNNVTKGDLMHVMPFDSKVTKVTMSGSDVWNMLENSVSTYNDAAKSGRFLQMSGMRVTYDLQKPPGRRVVKVYMRCGECSHPEYSDLNMSATYNILISSFLSNGGDGYAVFKGQPSTILDYSEFECVVDYIKSHSPVLPVDEGRIIIKNL